jgi:aspartyl/asparaginyl-tRNA synthetase
MTRTKIADALKSTEYGATINIKGWVRTRRGNKTVSFIALNDGSTINNIQVVADNEKFGDEYLKPSRETSNLPVQALFSYELIGFSSMIKYFCPEY